MLAGRVFAKVIPTTIRFLLNLSLYFSRFIDWNLCLILAIRLIKGELLFVTIIDSELSLF
jgi:hypothetical protein